MHGEDDDPAPGRPLPQVLHQEEGVEDVHALGGLGEEEVEDDGQKMGEKLRSNQSLEGSRIESLHRWTRHRRLVED